MRMAFAAPLDGTGPLYNHKSIFSSFYHILELLK